MLMMDSSFPARSSRARQLPAGLRQARNLAAHRDLAKLVAAEPELAEGAPGTARDLAAIAQPRRAGIAGQRLQLQARLVALLFGGGLVVDDRLERVSRPGLRVYRGSDALPQVMNGLGVAIVTTSRGVMTDRRARATGVGGEVIAYVA